MRLRSSRVRASRVVKVRDEQLRLVCEKLDGGYDEKCEDVQRMLFRHTGMILRTLSERRMGFWLVESPANGSFAQREE